MHSINKSTATSNINRDSSLPCSVFAAQLFGFGIVWVALALLTFDSLRAARAARAGRREPPVEPCP